MLKKIKIFCFVVFIFLIGWFAGLAYWKSHINNGITQVRENSSNYKFINPLIYISDYNVGYIEYSQLKSELNNYISTELSANKADDISIYFDDINGGDWIGVNENDHYHPGSLLKVAIMIAYYKYADVNPNVFFKQIYYKSVDDPAEKIKPAILLKPDYYSVGTLIKQMIIESDNSALKSLISGLSVAQITQVHMDLKLPDPLKDAQDQEAISPRDYSHVFRSLYNGSYLSHDLSEKALALLSNTKFQEGIVSGVSSSTIIISHKFGEFKDMDNGITLDNELHDCGIVYYPGKPYFICIMTKGQDFDALQKIISDISKITFDFVEKQ